MNVLNYQDLYAPLLIIFSILYIGVAHYYSSDNKLELVSLGCTFYHNGKYYNLSQYFLDKNGKLYSRNRSTWEINPRYNKDILICSDSSEDWYGRMHNTLRTVEGNKVTIKRCELDFKLLKAVVGHSTKLSVLPTGKRHLKITRIGA